MTAQADTADTDDAPSTDSDAGLDSEVQRLRTENQILANVIKQLQMKGNLLQQDMQNIVQSAQSRIDNLDSAQNGAQAPVSGAEARADPTEGGSTS